MDLTLLLVYLLILIFGICLYLITLILGLIMYSISTKNKKISFEFFKNIIIGIFGGIVVALILELNGKSVLDFTFWIVYIPATIILIIIFVLLGLGYMIGLEKIYDGIFIKWLNKIKRK